MSQIQQQKHTNASCKNSKQKNEKKQSEGGKSTSSSDPKEAIGVAAKAKTANKIPLQIPMEQLQMAQKPVTSIASRKDAGSNWEAVAKATKQIKINTNVTAKGEEKSETLLSKSARLRQKRRAAEQKYVAIDCEMVGVGANGQDDMLARVSIVSKRGEVLLDKFVKPQEPVTDYRTKISGIRPHDMQNGEDFKSVQEEVVQILQGKILIGHAIKKDLAVLHLKHPQSNIRDTARYKPLCRLVANGHTPSLKRLTQAILNKEIQTGEHNSIEDARAAMSIYNLLAKDWEAYIKQHQQRARK